MLACLCTAAWVNLGKDGFFQSDPTWDEAFFEDERIWLYETLYYTEIFGMCFALISTASLPQPASETLYMSATLTALLIFFAAASRFANRNTTGLCMSYTAFALLCAMVSSFVFTSVDTTCTLPILSGVTLALVVLALAIFHYIAAGAFSAGSIVLFRTLVSNACSLVLVATLAAGRTSACQLHSHDIEHS
jgi:hypothetical protein